MPKITNVKNPVIDPSEFTHDNRRAGLSGFIRAKNEGEFIFDVIQSWMPLLDELVIVFNSCTDNTESEIERALNKYGDKIKAFHYLPTVYPQGSKEHIQLPPDSINSLVNYYNFSLAKTSYKLAVKIDGDIILDNSKITEIKRFAQKQQPDYYLKLQGVNLIDHNNILYIPSRAPFCGMNGDLCVFPVSSTNFFKWNKKYEQLNLSGLKAAGGTFAYYHMKFVKKDMGFSNYLLKENKNSRYVNITKFFIFDLDFLSIKDFLTTHNISLSSTKDLNIKALYKRDFIESYKSSLAVEGYPITKFDFIKFKVTNTLKSYKQALKHRRREFKKYLKNIYNTKKKTT